MNEPRSAGPLEIALWALTGLVFAYGVWLCSSLPRIFGGVLFGYRAMFLLGCASCVIVPRLVPRRGEIPYGTLAATGMLGFALDQTSKWLAVAHLKGAHSIPLVSWCFSLTYVQNPGAAFGLLRGYTTLFIFMAFVTVIIIGAYFRLTDPDERLVQIALVFILAGALGNLMDRVFLGYVIDFLEVFYGTFKWPVFNVADSIIDVGVGLIVIDVVRDVIRGEKVSSADDVEPEKVSEQPPVAKAACAVTEAS